MDTKGKTAESRKSSKADKVPFSDSDYDLESCTLTPLNEDDADHISEVLHKMQPWLSLNYSKANIERYLVRDDPGLYRYTIRSGAEIAGVVCIRNPWLRGTYLELLALYPRFQGAGFGKQVISWMEERTRVTWKNMWAVVSSFNSAALGFYLRMGFAQVAPLDDLLKSGYTEILLRKQLIS